MSWLRIDDGFADHPKIDELTDKAFRIHVAGLCLCARKLTDGYLTERDVRSILARHGGRKTHLTQLETQLIWSRSGSGWVIRDYLDYNPSAEQVKEDRKRAAERMRRLRSGERAPERSGEHTGERSGEVRRPRPVPSYNNPSTPNPAVDADDIDFTLPPLGAVLKDMPR